jgi:hypothetical protein
MPNHLHGIIVLTDRGGASRRAPTKRKTLGRLVGAFKTVSTDRFNEMSGIPGAQLWQRDIYDHIIGNEDELNKIREYTRTNPLQWGSDPDFTQGRLALPPWATDSDCRGASRTAPTRHSRTQAQERFGTIRHSPQGFSPPGRKHFWRFALIHKYFCVASSCLTS